MRDRFPSNGATLLELFIGIAIFGMISVALGLLIRTGTEYIQKTEERAELQRTSLYALSGMSREIAESSHDSIRLNDQPTGLPGIVYATPRGNGGVTYSNNNLQWKRIVGVYWDSTQELLLRTEEDLAAPTTFVPDLSTLGLNKSVSYFASLNNSSRKLLARNVSGFSVTATNGFRVITFDLEVYTTFRSQTSTLTTRTGVSPSH